MQLDSQPGHVPGSGRVPSRGRRRGNHTGMFLSLSSLSLPLSLKINKILKSKQTQLSGFPRNRRPSLVEQDARPAAAAPSPGGVCSLQRRASSPSPSGRSPSCGSRRAGRRGLGASGHGLVLPTGDVFVVRRIFNASPSASPAPGPARRWCPDPAAASSGHVTSPPFCLWGFSAKRKTNRCQIASRKHPRSCLFQPKSLPKNLK